MHGSLPSIGRLVLATVLVLTIAPYAVAQSDAVAGARELAAEERYDEALGLLEGHLADTPGDVDGRVVYGLVLSWAGRYAAAREQFQQVLAAAPAYTDARMGLANVEWWSGNLATARALTDQILTVDPGHPGARLLRQRLDAEDRPWSVAFTVGVDRFDDGREAWQSQAVTLGRGTPAGPVLLRARRADRFGLADQQVEVEFYPTFRAGTYAALGVGWAPDPSLFPGGRVSLDLYQSLGNGLEISAGYRHLGFDTPANMLNLSLTKYVGNWMALARLSLVPSVEGVGSTSSGAEARYYFGPSGTSFGALAYSRGLWREEVRSSGDLVNLDSHTLRGRVSAELSPRLGIEADAAASRQRGGAGRVVWQVSVGAGLTVAF